VTADRRKRLVFHTPSLRGGGAERVFVLMANEMAARGYNVTYLTWNAEGPNVQLLSGLVKLTDFGMPIRGEGFGKLPTLSGLIRTAGFLRRTRPYAIYSAPDFANLIVALSLRLSESRTRFFPSYHAASAHPRMALGSHVSVRLSKIVAARAEKAVAVSEGVGRDLVARGFQQERVVVINNPLPPPTAHAGTVYPWRMTLLGMGHGPVIACIGRLVPVKDHRTLLSAFARLHATWPARLVIFGEGPLEAELRAFARELGIADNVLFAGYVNDPAACYAVADLVVLSSLTEGFGNVLIEAMAAGVPVVSTDAPHGPREILDNGKYGGLVPVGNAEALAAAMTDALLKPLDAAVLQGRAADFDVKAIGDRYEALL
jgi:glycosyltransferase involved in cell wall biosynthesis